MPVVLVCEVCGKEFKVPPSRIKQAQKRGNKVRYCSRKCQAIAYRGKGNPMYGKKHKPESIEKMKKHPNRPRFKRGKGNPNYKRYPDSLLTPKKAEILKELYFKYYSYEHIGKVLGVSKNCVLRWVKKLKLKRGYRTAETWRKHLISEIGKCERCGYNKIPEILQLHHKDGNRKNNTRENIILLCPNCHEEVHYLEKTGRYNH